MKRSLYAAASLLLCLLLLCGCAVKVKPVATAAPTDTPRPTEAATPEPTEAPAPEPTPEPAPEPEPGETSEPDPAETPEPTSGPSKELYSETFETWSRSEPGMDGTIVGTAEIRYPVYTGPQSDLLNRLVSWQVSERKSGAEETLRQARNDQELFLQDDLWFAAYEETQTWSSFRWDDYLILVREDYTYLGGTHGMYGTTYYVTDFKTGRQVFLSEFLRENGTDLESVGETLVGLCYEMEADGDITYVDEGYIRESMTQDGSWYPDENGIHFIAGVYALAPYASGEIDVTVGWGLLEYIQPVDSGLYSRYNPDADSAMIDVLCRDYTPDSTMELPVIVGDEGIAAQAVNDEIALLARKYFASMEGYPEAEDWDRYETLICYPYTAGRYLNIIVTDLLETQYADYQEMTSWVYDKEQGRRVTLEEALQLSGCNYETFQELLAGALSQCTTYRLQDVAFRMMPDGMPEFYLLVYWTIEDDGFFYDAYTYLRMSREGNVYPCEEWLIDPMELDTGFTSGSLSCQWPGVYAGYGDPEGVG